MALSWGKISNGIEEFLEMSADDENVTETKLFQKSSAIKKDFKLYIKELRMRGKLSENAIEPIVDVMLNNYRDIKMFPHFNEILDEISTHYRDIEKDYEDEGKEQEAENIRKTILKIDSKILGNEGAHVDKRHSVEYLESVIRNKLDSNGINNAEIMKIIFQKSADPFTDFEEYEKLVNDVVISGVDAHLKTGEPPIKISEILDVMREFALTYNAFGDDEKCKEILEKALKLKQFEKTGEYRDLKAAYDEVTKPKPEIEVINDMPIDTTLEEKGFSEIDLDGLEEIEDENVLFEKFVEKLTLLPAFEKIFAESQESGTRVIENHDSKPFTGLPREVKLRNIFKILQEVRKNYPDVNITKCYVGKDTFRETDTENKIKSFDEYAIFPIDSTGMSILESFCEDKAGAVYLINTEDTSKVVSTTRTNAKGFPGVNHYSHGKAYVDNVISGLTHRIKEQQAETEQNVGLEVKTSEQKALEDMSTEELYGMLSSLDKEIESTEQRNEEIKDEIEITNSEEAELRKALIERINGKRKILAGIKSEQKGLMEEIAKKQETVRDVRKRVFGENSDQGPSDH